MADLDNSSDSLSAPAATAPSPSPSPPACAQTEVWLIRHGETEWSNSGAHTSRTDLSLTERGERQAKAVESVLRSRQFDLVLTSPLRRAIDTCKLAGYYHCSIIDDDLCEWNYGDLEGKTTLQIRDSLPGWTVWDGPVPNGESAEQVAERVDRVISRVLERYGTVALFAHGHVLRVLAARWLQLPPTQGKLFALDTGSVSRLGFERNNRVIKQWNLREAVNELPTEQQHSEEQRMRAKERIVTQPNDRLTVTTRTTNIGGG